MGKSDLPKILLDSDVVRHFISGGRILHLSSIFPGRFVMLDKVKDELCRSKSLRQPVTNFLMMSRIELLSFPSKREIIVEYAKLSKTFGVGESACMAVARFENKFIASSNLLDIKSYCEIHGIT